MKGVLGMILNCICVQKNYYYLMKWLLETIYTFLLPLFPGPLWLGVIVLLTVMGQMELFDHLLKVVIIIIISYLKLSNWVQIICIS